jgi:hypothetical protein
MSFQRFLQIEVVRLRFRFNLDHFIARQDKAEQIQNQIRIIVFLRVQHYDIQTVSNQQGVWASKD